MKSEKKILIPGLGIATSMGIGCACNMMYGELLVNPSTLLWLDKLCLPSDFSVPSEFYGAHVEYAIKSIFEAFGNEGNLEQIDKETMLSVGKRLECLKEIVQDELDGLLLAAPDEVRKKNNEYEINGNFVCNPYVVAGYASQLLAHEIGASCLADKNFVQYLRFKNQLLPNWAKNNGTTLVQIYNEVFSLVVANDIGLPKILFTNEKLCTKCKNQNRCEADFKYEVREAVARLIELRSSDSFCLLRNEIDKIIANYKNLELHSAQDVVAELRARALKIYKKQKLEFPKIKRWTNLAMIVAVPSSYLISKALGLPEDASSSGAAIAAGAQVIKEYIKHEESKGSWINFLNKRTTPYDAC